MPIQYPQDVIVDTGIVSADRIDASTLPAASVDLPFLSLFAFDQEDNLAPVLLPATAIGGGGASGGFTTQIQTTSAAFTIGPGLNGIHLILDVAANGTLDNAAAVGTRVALTAASTGTTLVAAGGATYRLKGVDDPGDPARATQLTMAAAGYYEFEVIRNTDGTAPGDGGSEAEWDVYGLPTGVTTKLSGPLDLASQTIIPGAPVQVTTGRTYATTDSGKSFRVDTPGGTQTILAGMGTGWRVTILNNTGSPVTIDGPGGTNVTLASGEVCEVMFWSSTTIKVARGVTVGIN